MQGTSQLPGAFGSLGPMTEGVGDAKEGRCGRSEQVCHGELMARCSNMQRKQARVPVPKGFICFVWNTSGIVGHQASRGWPLRRRTDSRTSLPGSSHCDLTPSRLEGGASTAHPRLTHTPHPAPGTCPPCKMCKPRWPREEAEAQPRAGALLVGMEKRRQKVGVEAGWLRGFCTR